MTRKLKRRQPRYWLVGANWDGTDKTDDFIRKSCWEMGYSDGDKPDLAVRREEMRQGDRIGIKSRCGQGSDQVRIKALGVILGHEKVAEGEDGRVFVDWKVTGMNRMVDAHGLFATIHGPFTVEEHPWVKEVFFL